MNQEQDLPKPPRISEWLATLFVPADVAEQVTGDLQEEFSALITTSGAQRARAWYRRQAVATILRAGPSAFRNAPFRMLITLVGGLWLIGFATRYSTQGLRVLLDAHRMYELDPSAYLFWLKLPLEFGRAIICTVVGFLVGFAAKRHEMPAAVTLALAQLAMFCAGTITLIAYGRDWFHWFVVMARWNVVCAIGTVAGARIIRLYRRSQVARRSGA